MEIEATPKKNKLIESHEETNKQKKNKYKNMHETNERKCIID